MAYKVNNQVMTGIPSSYGMPSTNSDAYVLPDAKAQPPAVLQGLPPVAFDGVFRPVPSANDQSTAVDRAKGVVIMDAPFAAASVCLGCLAMLALYWIRDGLWFQPQWFAYAILFLVCVFGGIFVSHQELVKRAFDDSPVSVEHHRIDAAVQMHTKTIDSDMQMRLAMLHHTLQLADTEGDE